MLCLAYYCICFLFNKIRDKGRTDSAGSERGGDEREGMGGEMTQTMSAHVNN
jgi:hypothetical protein